MKKKAKPVKGKPAGRMLTKTEPCASFFNFFAPPAVPDNPSEVDEEEMEELQHAMEEDYEIGRAPPGRAPPAALRTCHREAPEARLLFVLLFVLLS
jgi:nucleosome assembly protein 1-like 1